MRWYSTICYPALQALNTDLCKGKKVFYGVHAAVLDVMCFLFNSRNNQIEKNRHTEDGHIYTWITWTKIRDDIELFAKLNDFKTIKKIIDALVENQLVDKIVRKKQDKNGKYVDRTFYKAGKNFDKYYSVSLEFKSLKYKSTINNNNNNDDVSRKGMSEKPVPQPRGGLGKPPPTDVYAGDLEPKHAYGKYKNVLLSEREVAELKQSIGENYAYIIDWFSHKKQFSDREYRYKSDWKAIMRWGISGYYKENPKRKDNYSEWLERNKHKKVRG